MKSELLNNKVLDFVNNYHLYPRPVKTDLVRDL